MTDTENAVGRSSSPEDEHLYEQERLLRELTEQLATKEAEFAELGATLARFRVTYVARFAPLYAELDRLQAEILRLIAEQLPPDSPKAQAAAAEAEEAGTRAEESRAAAEDAEPDTELPSQRSAEFKALYRQVAKAVHPDLATDEGERERRNRLMAAASQAYADGDEDGLRRILAGEKARPEAVIGDDIGSRLVRVLRKIAQVRARFTELVQLHKALQGDSLWELFSEVQEAEKRGEDPLAASEADLRADIRSAHAQLAALRRS